MATWKEKFNKKYNHPKGTSHSLSDVSKETGVSKKGIQQIYNKGIGAYKTNPQSVRPNVTSKEQWAMARVYSSVMGGKASKVDAKELKMEMGGYTDKSEITKVILTDFDKKRYFGQYKKVFDAFNKGSLGFSDGAYELDSSGQIDSDGNYILHVSEVLSGDVEDRLSKIKGISFEEFYVDKELKMENGGILNNPNFKEWFGDSKVVDENGNPLVVYHGTSNDFKVFDKDKIGDNYIYSGNKGIFFTQKERTAKNYAELHSNKNLNGNNKGYVISSYLRIENPLYRQTNSDFYRPADRFDIDGDDLVREAFENGYDGIIVKGTNNDDLYVVFEPNQIKSATDNDGEYSLTNDNITMQMGGSTDDFDRTDFYKGYYERLSPSNFVVEKENEKITINMNDRYKSGGRIFPQAVMHDGIDEVDAIANGMFEKGGETNFNPDGKIKDKIVHASGDAGGMLVGKRHSEGGIKALNQSTGQPLEMEGGEVVITRNAVSDNKKRSFNGKMLTNRQILSEINESGGGVSFADGGQVPNDVKFDCNAEYEYGGKTMCGKDLAYAMGGVTTAIVTDPNEAMADLQSTYGLGDVYAKGGEVKDADWYNSTDIVDVGVWFLEENYNKGNIFESERYNISHKDLLDKLKSGKRDSKTIDQLKDMLFANGQNYSTSLYLEGYNGEDERILGEDIYYSIPNEYAKGGTIECGSCSWSWDRKDGGDDMYVCHKCGTDNEKYFGIDNSFEENIPFKDGGEVKTFGYPLSSEEKTLIKNKAIISINNNGEIKLGIIESITVSYFSLRIIYDENYAPSEPSKDYFINEPNLVSILNGTPATQPDLGIFKYETDINNIKELTLFQIETALKIQQEYGIYLEFSFPDFFDRLLNTNEPDVDSIKVIQPYNSYQELYKNYLQGRNISGSYGDPIGYTINDDNGTVHNFRVGKRKVIKNGEEYYWRIGNGKKIAPYYDWLLSVYGNTDSFKTKYNYEKFVTGTSKEYLNQQKIRKEQDKIRKEKEKEERKERQLIEANVFNYEKNFSLMNEISEKGTWKDLGFTEPFEDVKTKYDNSFLSLKKDLNTFAELLPNFQGSKDVYKRKKIIKEMTKIQLKLLDADVYANESITKSNDLFTSEGLLNYYFTQTTQSPVTPLDKPCGLPTPNGGKSKLPMSAYLNVRTNQFKKWFGDWEVAYDTNNYNGCSLMIDEDTKEPKIYYHGVSKFRGGQRGASAMGSGVTRPYGAFTPTGFNASYFADNMEYAKFYSGTSDILPKQFRTKGFVYSIFLNIKNPIDLLPLGLKCSYKNIKDYLLVVYGLELEYNKTLLEKMKGDVNSKNNTWQYIRNDSLLIDRLKDFGYDAIFQIGDIPKYDKKGNVVGIIEDKEFLTFEPNQVKSVGVLNSFYGEMFKDIRFKKGGYVSI